MSLLDTTALTRPPLPLYIDSTMISCFRSCPQKFLLEFVRGFRPPGISIDLHAGGCFASAVEEVRRLVWGSGLHLSDALLRAHGRFAVEWGDFIIPEYKRTAKTYDRVWEAVEQYFKEFPPHTDHVQPYFVGSAPAVEFTFAIPLDFPDFPRHPSGEPFLYSGRNDLFGHYQKRPVILDDKTTGGSISTGWAEKWDLRSQFLGYVWAAQMAGIDCEQVAVRGIAIQKTQIVIAETIRPYSNALVKRWFEQLRRDMWRLRKSWDEGYFDYNLGDACTSFGLCIFKDMCVSPEPERWASQYEVRHWNPLGKNPIEGDPSSFAPGVNVASSPINAGTVMMDIQDTPASSTPADTDVTSST